MVRESKDSSFSIICEGLAVGYSGKPLCNGFDLEINNGDYICIVGENGAGKSTLIKTLVGLIPAINGKVLLRGDIDKSDIGYLPQQREMQKDFPASVWEVVLSGCLDRLGFKPFYGHKERKLAADAIRELDLEDIKNESFRELSGGQRQRVLLARAIAGSKKVLVLDEPITGLDPVAAAHLYQLLNRLNQNGTTIITISHDISKALSAANKLLIMGDKPHLASEAERRAILDV
ncbi:MAG: ABC transporter ATP-binding protein [Mogibacterium diversum]|nr:ABC transporter ATP-binding protein [Mogibacterium diversum]MBF1359474.1 ABC transporter ATP-binding protein [Mogibacterium diversum]